MREAFKQWPKTTEDDISCDCKDAFSTVFLRQEAFSSFYDWVGLGVKSSLGPEEALVAKEKDLAALFAQHKQLCNPVHERRERPCDFKDEPRTVFPTVFTNYRGIHPVVSPLCRAVLLISSGFMTEERRILVVLTGENGALMGPAPSFDSIPSAEIIRHVGKNVVEVPLKTAVNYLRHLDDEEEKVNEVLRDATKTRIQKVDAVMREEAVEEMRRQESWFTALEVSALESPRNGGGYEAAWRDGLKGDGG